MNFISESYLFFLPLSMLLYYLLPRRVKNPVLLLLSYGFYMSSGPAYGLLLAFSTLSSYGCAIAMGREGARRRRWLLLALLLNLGLLFVFKYFDFFSSSADLLLGRLGLPSPGLRLNLLPQNPLQKLQQRSLQRRRLRRRQILPRRPIWKQRRQNKLIYGGSSLWQELKSLR